MVIRQILSRVNYAMHISLHKIRNNVNVFITRRGWRLLYVHETNDVLMVKELFILSNISSLTQKLNLTDNTLCVNQVFKSLGYFLDRNFGFD